MYADVTSGVKCEDCICTGLWRCATVASSPGVGGGANAVINTNPASQDPTSVTGSICVDDTGTLTGTISGLDGVLQIFLLCNDSATATATPGGTDSVGNQIDGISAANPNTISESNFFAPSFTCVNAVFLIYDASITSGFAAFGWVAF